MRSSIKARAVELANAARQQQLDPDAARTALFALFDQTISSVGSAERDGSSPMEALHIYMDFVAVYLAAEGVFAGEEGGAVDAAWRRLLDLMTTGAELVMTINRPDGPVTRGAD